MKIIFDGWSCVCVGGWRCRLLSRDEVSCAVVLWWHDLHVQFENKAGVCCPKTRAKILKKKYFLDGAHFSLDGAHTHLLDHLRLLGMQ